jgi:type IV secretory pathway TraG/TraD family ATPase VirD4
VIYSVIRLKERRKMEHEEYHKKIHAAGQVHYDEKETVQAGVTGTFFHEQSVAALQNVLSGFAESTWRPDDIRGHAETFSTPRFRAALQTHMQAAYENRR